jgi:hypothetical protein
MDNTKKEKGKNSPAIVLVVVLMGLLAMSAIVVKNLDVKSSRQEIIKDDLDAKTAISDQRALREAWMHDAQILADLSKDPEAQMIMTFLREHGGLGRPKGEQLVLMESSPKLPTVIIVPIAEEDECTGPWEKLGGSKAPGALFQQLDGNTAYLAVKSVRFSNFGRGLAFLHEGHIAYQFMNLEGTSEPCAEDREASIFQHRVMALVGGIRYAEVLNAEVARLMSAAAKKREARLPKFKPDLDTLEDAFGPSASEAEEDFRKLHLWINAIFRYFDLAIPKEAKQRQAEFICSLLTPSETL